MIGFFGVGYGSGLYPRYMEIRTIIPKMGTIALYKNQLKNYLTKVKSNR